jgi:hypothetical protein
MIQDAFRPITPAPDHARAQALRETLDAAPADTFGEGARTALVAAADRLAAEARQRDLGDCQDLLLHVRSLLDAMDPRQLQTRRGLAGLFDSRSRRLKVFRRKFEATAASLLDVADTLEDRARGIARRITNLDGFANDLRGCILEAEAHVAAAADRARPPVDDEAPSPFHTRVTQLAGAAGAAMSQLPLTRMSQNAQHEGPDSLKAVSEALRAWALDWRLRLGLDRRRPRRVRPDQNALRDAKAALETALDRTEQYLTAARARHGQAGARMAAAIEAIRRG